MKIETNQPLRSVDKKKNKNTSAGVGFANAISDAAGASSSAPLANTEATANIGSILALQELTVDGETVRKAVQQGYDLLDQLDNIRLGILTGSLSKESLEKIAEAAQTRQNLNLDLKLKTILDDIHLRAQVELAKIEQSLTSK